jgi:toxin ParE1/3/4
VKERLVVFSPEAIADIESLYDWIAEAAGPHTAFAYITRLERYCHGMARASERGHRRDDIRPGLRIVGFERRIAIAFTVGDDTVTILRLLYGGQSLDRLVD